MWLAEGQVQSYFRTINEFIEQKLKGSIEKLFRQLVDMIIDLELVSFEKQFVDVAKIEVNAHKQSFVWKSPQRKTKLNFIIK